MYFFQQFVRWFALNENISVFSKINPFRDFAHETAVWVDTQNNF